MFAFRTERFASLVILISTLGAIGAVTNESPPSKDSSVAAREYAVPNAHNLAWSEAHQNAPTPSNGGCYNGYCWAKCQTGVLGFVRGGNEWCYTSRASYSQSYQYVKCSNDGECNLDWKCAGPCAVI